MNREDLLHLEKLMNFLASNFLKKKSWKDVSKSEWTYIVDELNGLLQERNRKQKINTRRATCLGQIIYMSIW
jgi:hypothetical protein